MKLSIYINQEKAIEWGLNTSQCILVDLFASLSSWADIAKEIDGEIWYFFAKPKMLKEAPMLGDKVDTVYRLCKSLIDKGLIDFKKEGNKDFWKVNSKLKEWNFTMSEKNPSGEQELGKKSELPMSEKNPTSSENFPTYKSTILSEGSILDIKEKNIKKENLKDLIFDIIKIQNYFEYSQDVSFLKNQLLEFYNYWSEKKHGGRKERWEMEKTFDVNLRFHRWLANAQQYGKIPQKQTITVI